MTDYPRPPYDPWAVPDGLHEAWYTAWSHIGYIEWIMLGDASPQLTTGHDVTPTQCACYYTGSTWHNGPMVREYHLEQNPDCPLHWALSWLAPCRCTYGLHPTIWNPTHTVDVIGIGRRGAAYTFRIHPKCPHHGDQR